MSEELTDNDIKLLKKHFNTKLRFIGIGLHKLIDEHKKTPVSILINDNDNTMMEQTTF